MTKKEVADLLTEATFIYAKTMPEIKHWYTLRTTWDYHKFIEVVKYIRKYGKAGTFFKKKYLYYYLGDYKYWTMGEPLSKTLLINKTNVSRNNNNTKQRRVLKSSSKSDRAVS